MLNCRKSCTHTHLGQRAREKKTTIINENKLKRYECGGQLNIGDHYLSLGLQQ